MNEIYQSSKSAGLGVYIHIPFCASKCPYCDFTSAPAGEAERSAYLFALKAEILASPYRGSRGRTLYLGGGTPSELAPDQLADVVNAARDAFPLADGAEVSVECNPGTLTPEKLQAMRASGVNRVSLGVQSTFDGFLTTLGRIHTAREAREAFDLLRREDFDNINVDLIFGLPGQTLEDWEQDVVEVLSWAPEHVSLYGLMIEPQTEFGRLHKLGQLAPADDDLAAAMYEAALNWTAMAGLEQYEISNFAKSGRECRHNLIYWRNEEYVGFGVSAASFVSGARWINTKDRKLYAAQAATGAIDHGSEERLEGHAALGEELMLRLRLNEGVPLGFLSQRYNCNIEQLYGEEIASLVQSGLLSRAVGRLQLTPRGRLLASEVCVKFL